MPRDKRNSQRKNLYYYLKVFAGDSLMPMGRLEDISLEGILLFSKKSIIVDLEYEMRIAFPIGADETKLIYIEAKSIWCKQDRKRGGYLTGFKLLNISEELKDIIEKKCETSAF